ncbi:hydratase (plasmid) [Paracoccus kondratievae]|uniref:Hydratase n=1 Tax=Paracoccus kondratievae TaxID=135740 RepID=A0AAD3RU61_9RHOB|nr:MULTISPECIES: fumarylacetoacetate hydrolase family protein [Paracoccus]QFQ89773.1 hydratase [Paracoccus kondratievae]GLK64530.1 hydratase [Paracoccus kondratievae]
MNSGFDAVAAAQALLAVHRGAARFPGLVPPPPDPDAAYAVQRHVIQGLGKAGAWKMALLAGRDRHAAALPGRMVWPAGVRLPRLPSDACIEVETALILGADLPAGVSALTAMDAIAEVRLAFELIAPRLADRRTASPLELMADGFASAGIVLGDPLPGWRDGMRDPLGITLWLDDRQVTAPEVAASLAEAVDFLAWLSSHAAAQGLPLGRGDVIITGARIGPLPLGDARTARATVDGAGVFARLT